MSVQVRPGGELQTQDLGRTPHHPEYLHLHFLPGSLTTSPRAKVSLPAVHLGGDIYSRLLQYLVWRATTRGLTLPASCPHRASHSSTPPKLLPLPLQPPYRNWSHAPVAEL